MVGTLGPGRETCVDQKEGKCSQGVERGDVHDGYYGNRHHDCGAAHVERCGSVGASGGSVFERAGLCLIRHLVKRTKK